MTTIHMPKSYLGHSNQEIIIDGRLFNTWGMCRAREQNIYINVMFFQNYLSNESNEMQMIFFHIICISKMYFKKIKNVAKHVTWFLSAIFMVCVTTTVHDAADRNESILMQKSKFLEKIVPKIILSAWMNMKVKLAVLTERQTINCSFLQMNPNKNIWFQHMNFFHLNRFD